MKEAFKKGFFGAIISGIIGSIILMVLLYFLSPDQDWLLLVLWFAAFIIIISVLYGLYFEKCAKK